MKMTNLEDFNALFENSLNELDSDEESEIPKEGIMVEYHIGPSYKKTSVCIQNLPLNVLKDFFKQQGYNPVIDGNIIRV